MTSVARGINRSFCGTGSIWSLYYYNGVYRIRILMNRLCITRWKRKKGLRAKIKKGTVKSPLPTVALTLPNCTPANTLSLQQMSSMTGHYRSLNSSKYLFSEYSPTAEPSSTAGLRTLNMSCTYNFKISIIARPKFAIRKAMESASDCTGRCRKSFTLLRSEESFIKTWKQFSQISTNGCCTTIRPSS